MIEFIICILIICTFFSLTLLLIYNKNNKCVVQPNNNESKKDDTQVSKCQKPIYIVNDLNVKPINDVYKEKIYDRLEPPGVYYEPIKYVPINIRTRGMPTEYQQIGILTNITDSKDVKPLYGRQTYRGSNKWNYYSSTDSNLSLKIPVYILNDKCTDERGCNEIVDGSKCKVGDKNENLYISTIYSNEGYRYIHDII